MIESEDRDRRRQVTIGAAVTRSQHGENHSHPPRHEIARRRKRFNQVVKHLMHIIVRPRAQELLSCFENCELANATRVADGHCVLRFHRTPRLPVTATLDLFVCPDARIENVLVESGLTTVPFYVELQGQGRVSFPLEQVNDAQLAKWVDERMSAFVDAYLQVVEAFKYQRENAVVDPVCRVPINKLYAVAVVNLNGQAFYFCRESCQWRFLENPAQYVSMIQ